MRKKKNMAFVSRVLVIAFEPSSRNLNWHSFRPSIPFLSVRQDRHCFLHACARCSSARSSSRWLTRFSFARKVTMFTREALRVNFFRVFRQREHKAIRRPARDIIFAALLSNGNHFRLLPPSKRGEH